MSKSNTNVITTNVPLLLTIEEKANPEEVLTEFLKTYDLQTIRAIITDMFSIALCAPKCELEGRKRTDIRFTQQAIIRFIEAYFVDRQLSKI